MGEIPGNDLVPIALLGWPLASMAFYFILPPRRALLACLILGFLFLPRATINLPSIPPYDKGVAIGLSMVIGMVVFNPRSLLHLRPSLLDLPLVVACLAPAAASLTNGLGAYDALSSATVYAITWAPPYVVGRACFATPRHFREFGAGLVLGGLLYIPFILWEVRMSPQLMWQVYELKISFIQNLRWGGYRPCVFIGHGLPLSLMMMETTVMCFWLWRTRAYRQIFGIPMWAVTAILVGATVICKGSLALVLLAVGVGMLPLCRSLRSLKPVFLLGLLPLLFILIRASGAWDAHQLVDWSESVFGEKRASSLEVRVRNDTMLAEKARQKALFGWGGWGRNRVADASGRDISVVDSLWVSEFGKNGAVGMLAILAIVLVPASIFSLRAPPLLLRHPATGAMCAGAVLMVLWMIDLTQNATVSPTRILAAGALAGMTATLSRRRWRVAVGPRPTRQSVPRPRNTP